MYNKKIEAEGYGIQVVDRRRFLSGVFHSGPITSGNPAKSPHKPDCNHVGIKMEFYYYNKGDQKRLCSAIVGLR
jgi:hypothetical protein